MHKGPERFGAKNLPDDVLSRKLERLSVNEYKVANSLSELITVIGCWSFTDVCSGLLTLPVSVAASDHSFSQPGGVDRWGH